MLFSEVLRKATLLVWRRSVGAESQDELLGVIELPVI